MSNPDYGLGWGVAPFWRKAGDPLNFVFRWIWSLDHKGARLPPGPLVVASNHFSHLDVLLLGKALGPVRYMAVDELFGLTWVGDTFITMWGGIKVPRYGIPLAGMREALVTLDQGSRVGLFPEGRRVWSWGEEPPRRGAAWLAQKASVPMVPVAIVGSEGSMGRGALMPRPWPVEVRAGSPIHPSDFPPGVAGSWEMVGEWRKWMDYAIASMRSAAAANRSMSASAGKQVRCGS